MRVSDFMEKNQYRNRCRRKEISDGLMQEFIRDFFFFVVWNVDYYEYFLFFRYMVFDFRVILRSLFVS